MAGLKNRVPVCSLESRSVHPKISYSLKRFPAGRGNVMGQPTSLAQFYHPFSVHASKNKGTEAWQTSDGCEQAGSHACETASSVQ